MFIGYIAQHRPQTLGAGDGEHLPTEPPGEAYAVLAAPGTARAHRSQQVAAMDRREIDRISFLAMGNTYCNHLPDNQRSFTRR